MKIAAQCPHCKTALAVEVQVGISVVSAVVDQARTRNGRRLQGHQAVAQRQLEASAEGSGGCVQATPQSRCPTCGQAAKLVYGRKKDGRGWQGLKCTNLSICGLAQEDKFLPGSFRWLSAAPQAA